MKNIIRQKTLLERLNHHLKQKEEKDKQIISRILRSRFYKISKNTLHFYPIKGEPDLTPLFAEKDHQSILPRITKNNTLSLHFVKDHNQELIKGKYNIPEPRATSKAVRHHKIDLIFVPGIAFSTNGHRIGFGKGYYDRLLKKARHARKVGIAYEFQLVNNIPAEKHDIPVDMIITERRTIYCKK